mgnify:CR=1 FL=1
MNAQHPMTTSKYILTFIQWEKSIKAGNCVPTIIQIWRITRGILFVSIYMMWMIFCWMIGWLETLKNKKILSHVNMISFTIMLKNNKFLKLSKRLLK